MKKNKTILEVVASLCVCFGLVGCGSGEVPVDESSYQKEVMDKTESEVGMPNITEFTEKKMAKMIWEMRDDSELVTYSYITNLDGKFVYLGQSIGYGLPYSTQYTNPLKAEDDFSYDSKAVVAQADPNGLYSGDGLSSTWIMLVDEASGDVKPVYVEQELFVSVYKLPRRLCDESSLPENY